MMRSKTNPWMMMAVMALMVVMLNGCAIGIGGGRATFTMPFGDPITVEGSTAVAAKHGKTNGAVLPQNATGTAAKADADTLGGTADQIVMAGGNISTDKATDVGATSGVGNQATKAAGVVGGGSQGQANDAGGNTATPSNQLDMPMTGQGAATVSGMSAAEKAALRAEILNEILNQQPAPATP
jgi:hypothetical protein